MEQRRRGDDVTAALAELNRPRWRHLVGIATEAEAPASAMDAALAADIAYRLEQAREWPCACASGGCREAVLCDSCLIVTSLDAAAEHAAQGNWRAAHRAVLRAATRDWRLEGLRDDLGRRAWAAVLEVDAPAYESMEVIAMVEHEVEEPARLAEGSGPIVMAEVATGERHQDPDVLYDCGKTYAQHKEIALDRVLREQELIPVEPFRDARGEPYLGQGTCRGCHSTFTWPLPERDHREVP